MNLTKADLITIAMAVLVPAGAYLGYFKPRISRLGALNRQVADLERKTAGSRKTSNDISVARSNIQKLERRISRFMGAVTTEDDAHGAVGAVVRDAKEAGFTIDSMRPGSPAEGKVLSYLPVNLTASGEFHKFYDFLLRIERDDTVMTINKMHVESDPLSKECAVTLELRIYFVKPRPAAGKGTQT